LFLNESFSVSDQDKFVSALRKTLVCADAVSGFTKSAQGSPHIQSYLFFVPAVVLRRESVRAFWEMVGFLSKQGAIAKYEIGFSRLLQNESPPVELKAVYKPGLLSELTSRARLLAFGNRRFKLLAFGSVNPTLIFSRQVREQLGVIKIQAAIEDPYFRHEWSNPNSKTEQSQFLNFKNPSSETAVIVHCYYTDGIFEALERLAGKHLDFFITTDNVDKLDFIRGALEGRGQNLVAGLVDENRGRDVLPFLKIMSAIPRAGEYTSFLKLHLKESRHSEQGKFWIDRLFEGLLEDSNFQQHIKNVSSSSASISAGLDEVVCRLDYDGGNEASLTTICNLVGIARPQRPYTFIAGNMFFMGTAFFHAVQRDAPKLLRLQWEEERGQLDGTIAHAMERVWIYWAAQSGRGTLCVKGGLSAEPDPSICQSNSVPTVNL
jgi:lipopolysaccharide biosynthesis protein